MVMPGCGIVLNRFIANRYSILIQPLLSMSRVICAPANFSVAANFFGSSREPPLFLPPQSTCITLYFPLSHCLGFVRAGFAQGSRGGLQPSSIAQLNCPPHTTERVDHSTPTSLLPRSEGICNPLTASNLPTAAQSDLVDGTKK
jgi:hypothetical protein